MRRSLVHGFLIVVGGMMSVAPLEAASNFQWTFDASPAMTWRVTAVGSSSPNEPATRVYEGSAAIDNPTINLILGKRYAVTNVAFGAHFVDIIAKGATSGEDIILLSEAPGVVGSLEADAGINWVDSGTGLIEFTVTQTLLDAMRAPGRIPGYRCNPHAPMMRGDFAIYGDGTPITNPIPEPLPKGSVVVELLQIADGLVSPLGVVQSDDPSDDRLFIYDQAGKVWIVRGGARPATPFLDVSSRLVTLNAGYDERGLLGLAFHPNFAATKKVYTYTSEPVSGPADFTVPLSSGSFNHQSVVAEWQVSTGDPDQIDPSTRRELLRIDQPQSNHNGGTMRFGPDGKLYIALGDGGAANDVGNGHDPVHGNAQNPENVLGTLLRIDVDGTNSANGRYGVPADNPTTISTIREIWAYGFRNPYAFSFDRATGRLWLGDVGQNRVEEVDLIVKAGNYGWNYKEGTFHFNFSNGSVVTVPPLPIPSALTLLDPVAQYDHDEGIAVVGGFVYRGSLVPDLIGRYVFGDFARTFSASTGRLFYLDASNNVFELRLGTGDRPLGALLKGMGEDRSGELYVCVSNALGPSGTTGKVYRIVGLSAVRPGVWERAADR